MQNPSSESGFWSIVERQTKGTAMDVSSALLVDRVLQMEKGQSTQAAQFAVLKKAMTMQESASQALISAASGDLPLAAGGTLGTQVNTLV